MVTPCGSATAKTLTQVIRLLSEGMTKEIFAETSAAGEGISEAQFEVLRYIDRHEQPTIGGVAEALHISSAAATKMATALSEGRRVPLIERSRGCDRRTVHLATTPAGAELVRRVRAAYTERLEAILARMAPADREALLRGVKAFLEAALERLDDVDAACLRCGIDGSDDCLVRLAEVSLAGCTDDRRC